MDAVVNFVRASILSYRALFSWLNPLGYLSSRLLYPVLLALVFGSLHGNGGGRPSTWPSAPRSTRARRTSAYQTMQTRMTTLEDPVYGIVSKSIVHVLNGVFNAIVVLLLMVAVLGVAPSARELVRLSLVLVLAGLSGAARGVVTAAVAIRTRQTFVAANVLNLAAMVSRGGRRARHPGRRGLVPAVLGAEIVATVGWAAVGALTLAAMNCSVRRTGSTHLA